MRVNLQEDLPGAPHSSAITGIVEDNSGKIWISTFGSGLFSYDKYQASLVQVLAEEVVQKINIRTLCASVEGKIWVGTNFGLKSFVAPDLPATGQMVMESVETSSLREGVVLSIMEDHQSRLWIGKENQGLVVFDPMNQSSFHYWSDANDAQGLSNNSIWSLYQDKSQTIWIGTYKRGMNKIDPFEKTFHTINEFSGTKKSISYGLVSAFAEDGDHNLWIGTDGGGLNFLDWKSKEVRHFTTDQDMGLKNDVIVSLLYDKQDNLWVGTWGNGIYIKPKILKQISSSLRSLSCVKESRRQRNF